MQKAGLKPIEKQIEKLSKQIEKRFNFVDQRFEHMDQRFDEMDQKFDKQLKNLEQKFENHTQVTENRFTNILTICTALRGDMGALRNEWALWQKKDEARNLETRVSALEISVQGIEKRLAP